MWCPPGIYPWPSFFIIYINDLSKASKIFDAVIYADDTALSTTLNTSDKNHETNLNSELKLVSDWLKLNRLSLNTLKTKAMLFHTPQKHVTYPKLIINSQEIEFVKDFNYLGICIDENSKWKTHTDIVSKKISKTLGILSRLKYYLPKDVLLNIYNALILPFLNYGITVWGGQSNRTFKLQKRAVRLITNSRYNAHTDPLFRQLKLLKIKDIMMVHDLKFCFKYMNNLLPAYFYTIFETNDELHSHNTRQHGDFRLPAVRHDFARLSIRYRFPVRFNKMKINFKSKIFTHSLDGFKRYVKNDYINSYETECLLPDCRSCGH